MIPSGRGRLFWFLLKLTCVIYLFILVRATLPRMRYDRLMNFGWKVPDPVRALLGARDRRVIVLPERYPTVLFDRPLDVTRGW